MNVKFVLAHSAKVRLLQRRLKVIPFRYSKGREVFMYKADYIIEYMFQ